MGLKTGPGSGSWLNKRLVVAGLLVKSGDDWALTSSGDDFGHWVEDVKDGVVRRWIVWCPEIIDSVVADSGRVVRVSESVLKSSSLSVDVAGLVAENAELRARVDRLTDALLKLTVPA